MNCDNPTEECATGESPPRCVNALWEDMECNLHRLVDFGMHCEEADYRRIDRGCCPEHDPDEDIPF
jgi:hypothetical protein